MRIGVLTLPLHSNFGGLLQAYALQTILERLGHKVVVFQCDYLPLEKKTLLRRALTIFRRIVKKILGKDVEIFRERRIKKEIPLIRENTNRFIVENIHTKSIDLLEQLRECDYDAIVVGSDQIWRPKYFKKMWKSDVLNAFLKFAEGWSVKRCSYAASFGVDSWEFSERETDGISSLLRMFDAVSVREKSGINLCQRYAGVSADFVLDPTLLLDRSEYESLFLKKNTAQSKGSLLDYTLDETLEKKRFIEVVAKNRGLRPFSVKAKNLNDKVPLVDKIQPTVESWLRGFYDAELVVTDSFHACVFSIIFNKPFVVFGNEKRGQTRIESLLKQFGLENRIVQDCNIESVKDSLFSPPNVDYSREKEFSMTFLKDLF